MDVKPKKNLGQHFLTDKNIAQKIVDSMRLDGINSILEIGPGKGILTGFILKEHKHHFYVVDIDKESIDYLKQTFHFNEENILHADFLKQDILKQITPPIAIIGNLPYNISSQIMFKLLENKDKVIEMVCMIQKEVAERFAAKPNSKTYGILSVLLQAFYDIEYLFSVNEKVFFPQPKVQSAVIRLHRKQNYTLTCPEDLFFKLVKAGFGQRRKTLRNSLKPYCQNNAISMEEIFNKRPEQLGVNDFIYLTNLIANKKTIETKTS
jgi:16S rRNA (adenine1518-N6/adenine1519-N6)-dimethyltransferase